MAKTVKAKNKEVRQEALREQLSQQKKGGDLYKYVIKKGSELKPYDRNSRTHTEDQINQVADSIKEFGFTNPILIDENDTIIAGHCRLEAGKIVGMNEFPCIILAGLTDEQRRAYVIADNQLALNAGWDMELLKAEVIDLDQKGFDIEFLGFDDFDEDLEKDELDINDSIEDEGVAIQITGFEPEQTQEIIHAISLLEYDLKIGLVNE